MGKLRANSLNDAPSLIDYVFPSQKVSFEAQKERKSGAGQTLTALGSYWKGRKPLILVRAIVLGSLLPVSDDREKDLEIFEKLMAFDEGGLARRALVKGDIKPTDIAENIRLQNPWDFFTYSVKKSSLEKSELDAAQFPFDASGNNVTIRWRRDVEKDDKIRLISAYLSTLVTYEEKASLGKRPEEIDQEWLYETVWPEVNAHLSPYNIEAYSFEELVDQLGTLRFGGRPRVGDPFSGGGSIPFEAARMGCDVYASDLNPIAAMLTWGSLHIIGASKEKRREIERAQKEVAEAVDREIRELGIEHDAEGNRAKAYLYCLETRCPETGWMVPLSPSWVISKTRNVIARLVPDHMRKRFEIEVVTDVSDADMKEAEKGTVQDGSMVYRLDGRAYRTPIKTIRGDYIDERGVSRNRLRRWTKNDFMPRPEDIFQERLYAVQWIKKESLEKGRHASFFTSVTEADVERERKVERIVGENLSRWQEEGLVPDMEIEPGDKTDEPIRTRGWTHWHHLFTPRNLLVLKLFREKIDTYLSFQFLYAVNFSSKLCRWATSDKRIAKDGSGKQVGGASDNATDVFSNQALNPNSNYAHRSAFSLVQSINRSYLERGEIKTEKQTACLDVQSIEKTSDIWITDPPYADAVNYEEITEYFIAWLRKNPPMPFDAWIWDSRRALAIKGNGDDFRHGMVDAYKRMTDYMPENGTQVVMFTHQDTGVWTDMVGIFWSAGLQVISAWYIATETTSELKKGGYVQGTVILVLKKRTIGERIGFKQRILPQVRAEVDAQIMEMMNLNDQVRSQMGDPVFNDSDLQMAGYAAALKVLTGYTQIGGEDVTTFALRPRRKGEVTVVDEMVQQASETANSVLVPEGLSKDTWLRLNGIQRFFLRMLDIETTGASKLDNYQNFAKAFRVDDYTKVMGSLTPNQAHLKRIDEFSSRDLSDSTEIGPTWLGSIIIALQQMLIDTDPKMVVSQMQYEMPDFFDARPYLIDILYFLEKKASDGNTREASEVLSGRLRNLPAFGEYS